MTLLEQTEVIEVTETYQQIDGGDWEEAKDAWPYWLTVAAWVLIVLAFVAAGFFAQGQGIE